MKKNILITILVIACVVLCCLNVGILQEKTKLITKNTQLQELTDSIAKELFNYQMSPNKLKEKADIALDNEDEETIKEVIALLEKYHPESNQYTKVKNYLDTLFQRKEQRRIAEEKRKQAELNKKLMVVKRLKKEYDDVSNVTWYYNPYFTHFNNRFLTSIYIGKRNNYVWLRLKMSFCGETFLSINEAYLSYGGNTQRIYFDTYKDRKTDCDLLSSNPWWEWFDVPVSEDLLEYLRGCANAKSVKMRFVGDKYTRTRTLSTNEMKALKDVLLAYDVLRGL